MSLRPERDKRRAAYSGYRSRVPIKAPSNILAAFNKKQSIRLLLLLVLLIAGFISLAPHLVFVTGAVHGLHLALCRISTTLMVFRGNARLAFIARRLIL